MSTVNLNPGDSRQRRGYTCQDCGKRVFIRAFEFNRAAKPKCTGCGCTRLDPSFTAKLETAVRNDMARGVRVGSKTTADLSAAALAWRESHPRAYHYISRTVPLEAIERAATLGLDEPAWDVDGCVRFRGRACRSYIARVELHRGQWVYTDTDGNAGCADDFS